MPAFAVGFGGERLMPMVRASVASSTWTGYGKAWEEWLTVVGDRRVDSVDTVRLEVTKALVGLAFQFKLRGWPDVTKSFVIHQALKGWRKEHVARDRRLFPIHCWVRLWKPLMIFVPPSMKPIFLGIVFVWLFSLCCVSGSYFPCHNPVRGSIGG